jgi:hypothetical protein
LKTLSKEQDFNGAQGAGSFAVCDCQNNTGLLGGLKHLSLSSRGYPGGAAGGQASSKCGLILAADCSNINEATGRSEQDFRLSPSSGPYRRALMLSAASIPGE